VLVLLAAAVQAQTAQESTLTVCTGASFTLKSVDPGTGGADVTYAWTQNGAPIVGAYGASYESPALAAGEYTFVLIVSTAECDEPSNTVRVTVVDNSAAPVVTAHGLGGVGRDYVFTVPAEAGVTYTWLDTGGASGGNSYTFANATEGAKRARVTAIRGNCESPIGSAVVMVAQLLPPPYAASTQTWIFGDSPLVWSDAIHIPECDKETFEESNTDPQCRSYTDPESGKTYYYYNWPYVNANKDALCPAPWRVPLKDDFAALVANTGAAMLKSAWGYGGFVNGSSMDLVGSYAFYWSATEYSSSSAYILGYYGSDLVVLTTGKYYGFEVVCVR
jgi:hypothetical protein